MKVIKRDSRIKEFEFDRIENAVNNAYIEMYGDIREQNLEISKVLNNISEEMISSYIMYYVMVWIQKN